MKRVHRGRSIKNEDTQIKAEELKAVKVASYISVAFWSQEPFDSFSREAESGSAFLVASPAAFQNQRALGTRLVQLSLFLPRFILTLGHQGR